MIEAPVRSIPEERTRTVKEYRNVWVTDSSVDAYNAGRGPIIYHRDQNCRGLRASFASTYSRPSLETSWVEVDGSNARLCKQCARGCCALEGTPGCRHGPDDDEVDA